MQISRFERLLGMLAQLNGPQLRVIKSKVGERDQLEEVKGLAEKRRVALGACPHCGGVDPWRWGTTASGQSRFKCRACEKTFTPLTGTGFEKLRNKHKLIENAACMAEGLSVRATAERLQVNPKTAYLLRKKFMPLLEKHQPMMLAGMLEADEAFFRKSYKGLRSGMPRKSYKRGTPAMKRGINDEHTAVLTTIQRGTPECHIAILPSVPTMASVNAALEGAIAPGSVLCTDGSKVYVPVGPMQGVEVHSVTSAEHVDGPIHVQTVNALHSRMKAWLYGFKGVATRNLALYLAWFRFFDHDKSRPTWPGFVLDSFGVPTFNT